MKQSVQKMMIFFIYMYAEWTWGGFGPDAAPYGNTAPPPCGPEVWGVIWGVFPEVWGVMRPQNSGPKGGGAVCPCGADSGPHPPHIDSGHT
ncbi:hypothetical protein QVD17_09503 [Tagetes erecta]|uniref:Secreted protein n=1 Tax=Tagetes erecta TaxID=13708 RepID=A0AAD8L4S8_TARER|nr:hypothetical protein QVD17_09503 [Tagetes erecta]